MPLHRLRHFLFTSSQGIDDALIRPYSDHATRTSLEIYSRLALADAQHTYDSVIVRLRYQGATGGPSAYAVATGS
jgi:integrase/recombinase XerD